jgi:hypothetical protein
MRRPQPVIRNTLDLADARQVRGVRKRLRLSDSELTQIVGRIGNSIAAISKEVAVQRARRLPQPASVPEAALIAAVGPAVDGPEATVVAQTTELAAVSVAVSESH